MTGSPRFLLLQARKSGDPVAAHESRCFVDALGVSPSTIQVHSLLQGAPTPAVMAQCDLILVGGSGDFSVLDNEPWVHAFLDFIADTVVGRSFPAFCSCFGFQALVAAGGGEVIHDAVNTEVGTFEIVLNEAGMADPLLGTLGPQFLAQLGHKDRAKRIPAGMTQLGRSERCPYQALRVDGTQIFATQFHPELNLEANLHRYVTYREGYSRGGYDPGQDAVIQSMRETPGATALLPRWVQQVASNQD